MEEKMKKSRKDWIKNIAIIFLSIMLVLTFFSNSIMNYSLPEVATETVQSGTITAKIRGTGTVESDDPYKVSIGESRTISSVAVKSGDTVEKDQVLFYLEDKDSAELEAAEKELDELILSYTSAILKGEISNQSYDNIQSGNISTTGQYQTRIEAAKAKVDAAQANVDSLAKQLLIAGTTTSGQIDKEAELTKAKAEMDSAAARKADAQANLAAAEGKYGAMETETKLLEAVNAAKTVEVEKKALYETTITDLNTKLSVVKDENKQPLSDAKLYEGFSDKGAYYAYLDALLSTAPDETTDDSGQTINQSAEKAAVNAQIVVVKEAFETYYAAKSQRETADRALEDRYNMNSEIAKLTSAVNNANNSYNESKAKVDRLQNEITNNSTDNSKQKADLELRKIEADDALTKAKTEQAQLLMDVSTELNLGNQNSIIAEKQQEIAKLREKAVGATIVAPVSGIVVSVNKTAGETTQPEEALATMQPAGKGYTVKFSVTNEQAKRVTVGEAAELQNSWYYDDVTAILTAIRPDPAEPGQKKLLVFKVDGELQSGQNLSLSIGERSATYDLLVPNSAVREDNNGKFILVVEAKNSPLGNRYVANRVDVEVLGSDDTRTAINAPLYGYEYVVTTATKPVEAGKLVRLADN